MRVEFASSPRSSLGVEWELGLVDLQTRELASGASKILAEIRPRDGNPASEHPKAKHELFESIVEIVTGVCGTVAEARADLAATRAEVATAAARHGLGLVCSGTHPTTDWSTQEISPDSRYHRLIDLDRWLARRLLIMGVHVHVGIRSPAKVVPILNALTAYVPHFLALSASSPYWMGEDTGLASARTKIFETLPTAGLPYHLADYAEFEGYLETLIAARAIQSIREVWWDIRPHPNFGTVELRICDGLPTLDEVSAVAALSQCLVERLDRELDRGYTLPVPSPWVVRENKWRATRFGLDAEVIVDERGTVAPLRRLLPDLLEDLAPTARRLECADELAGVDRILTLGASYQRQRAVAAASPGDLLAVVDALLEEMRAGLPTAQA